MKNIVLEKSYDPKIFEEKIYKSELKNGDFKPKAQDKSSYFSVVMPPPNVTGVLHMGHALNITLQDVIVRYQRMKGKSVLWVPGTDHAGIATQHVVEKELAKEGKFRKNMTRDEFLKRTWQVKNRHHDIIVSQIQKMAASCDWAHERFTLDEGLSKAVRDCFVTLYERGLIYKGKYLVNYCPHCMTALSDDEVEYSSEKSYLWTLKYPFVNAKGYLEVATTRPETIFGDVAVAVHPDDPRYKGKIGKKVKIPLCDREIPIIADSFVDKEFGTGAVKITPAHDPHDRDCGMRHHLDVINILNPDGTLNENVLPEYVGLTVEGARAKIDGELSKNDLVIKKEPLEHEVGHCYRCNTIIEPYLSSQWFVKMDKMAEKALTALKEKQIVFYPKKWESTYIHWMSNIKDWCISRQLWWGHRIPVWYCKSCGHTIVSREDPKECPKCSSKELKQDEDVLDTWFSSWLWPFSTLGWPDSNSDDLRKFFPTSTLITAYDIIFFWVSRMIMASLEFMGKVPFKDIYITALVRDKLGRKMSKSLGNGIDPLEIIEKYGSDAMKFTLSYQAAQGQDIYIDIDSFKFGSKFANKLWNASRYILMNLDSKDFVEIHYIVLDDWDKWIYSRLNNAIEVCDSSLVNYKINDAAGAVYDFFWNDFCDWYLEYSKIGLYSDDPRLRNKTISVLLDILEKTLRLMHPLLPMITDEIYQKLPNKNTSAGIARLPFPIVSSQLCGKKAADYVDMLQDIVKNIRNLRSVLGIQPSSKVDVSITSENDDIVSYLKSSEVALTQLAGIGLMIVDNVKADGYIYSTAIETSVGVKTPVGFDKSQRLKVLNEELKIAKSQLEVTEKKLSNPQFVQKAKLEAVEKEKQKQQEFTTEIQKLTDIIKILGS